MQDHYEKGCAKKQAQELGEERKISKRLPNPGTRETIALVTNARKRPAKCAVPRADR